MVHISKRFSPYALLFFALPVVYFFLYGRYGFPETDDGFVLSLVWRVVHGEVPYLDFFYVRPPLTLYLHALPLLLIPPEYVIIVERFFVYASIALYCFFGTKILQRFFDFQKLQLHPYLFASIAFVFSVHNFFPMPWHTVDGILLSTIGLFLVSRKKSVLGVCAGIVVLCLAALTKQSFYLMPLVGMALVLYLYGFRYAVLAGATGASVGAVFFGLMNSWGLWGDFVQQVSGSTSLLDLLASGVVRYTDISAILPIAAVMVYLFVRRVASRFGKTLSMGWMVVFLILLSFLSDLSLTVLKHKSAAGVFDYPQLFFLIGISVVIAGWRWKEKRMGVLLALLMLAWSASISWGYQTPILFSVPLVFAVLYLLSTHARFRSRVWVYRLTFVGALFTFGILQIYPYRDGSRGELTYQMQEVFPRLTGVRSDKQTYEKYSELRELHEKYGDNFTALPAVLYAHFLTDTQNPIQVEWDLRAELNGDEEEVIERLESKNIVVFLENDQASKKEGNFGTPVSLYIQERWGVVEKGAYFTVYQFE